MARGRRRRLEAHGTQGVGRMAHGLDGEHHRKGQRSVSGRRAWVATIAVVLLLGAAALKEWRDVQSTLDWEDLTGVSGGGRI